MTERDVAAEVIKGLQEVRDHRAGNRRLRATLIEASPLAGLDPEIIERIRENLGLFRDQVPVYSCLTT